MINLGIWVGFTPNEEPVGRKRLVNILLFTGKPGHRTHVKTVSVERLNTGCMDVRTCVCVCVNCKRHNLYVLPCRIDLSQLHLKILLHLKQLSIGLCYFPIKSPSTHCST